MAIGYDNENIELIENINSKLILYDLKEDQNIDNSYFKSLEKEINNLASKYQVFCRILLNRNNGNTLEIFDASNKYVTMIKSKVAIERNYKNKSKIIETEAIINEGYYICDLYQDLLKENQKG